jgi:hypothetical protein
MAAIKKSKAAPPEKAPAKKAPPPPAGVGLCGYIGDRLAYVSDFPSAPDTDAIAVAKGLEMVELIDLKTQDDVTAWRKEHGYGR